MHLLTEMRRDGTQASEEAERVMLTLADGTIFFIREEPETNRLIISSYRNSLLVEAISNSSLLIDVKEEK